MTGGPPQSLERSGVDPYAADYSIRRFSLSNQSVMATRLLARRSEVDRLRRWLPRRRYQIEGGADLILVLDREVGRVTCVFPGGWLVRSRTGELQSMDDAEFRAHFRSV